MNENTNGVLLTSSGIDSFIIWFLLGRPRMLYVRLGHRYESRELVTLNYAIPEALDEFDLGDEWRKKLYVADWLKLGLFEWEDAHIPLRNSLLLHAGAVMFDDADEYYLGALKGEAGRDKSRRFYKLLSKMMTHSEGRAIKAFAPMIRITKVALVKRFKQKFDQYSSALFATTSCHYADETPGCVGCGQCTGCFRRWVAMSLNGYEEKYILHPARWAYQNWLSDADKRSKLRSYAVRADPRESINVLLNNFNAFRALRKARPAFADLYMKENAWLKYL